MSDGPLAGDVAWISGAASGIGASFVERFAQAGATVAALDIDEAALGRLTEGREPGAIATACVDVASWESTRRGCEALLEQLGPPRIVIANAGVSPAWTAIEDSDPREWARVVAVNLSGCFHLARAAAAHLRRTAPSSLLFTASVMGLGAGPGGAAYQASKHGVIGLMRTLANELGRADVRVNALCPGWSVTPMLEADIAESGGDREAELALRRRHHLLPRLIQPDDVASAALFLCSPAGAAITGVALPVDAGMLEQRGWISRDWQAGAAR